MSCEFYDNISSEDVQSSLLTTLSRLEDGKPEGRIAAGLEPVEKLTRQKMASERRGTATLTTDSRLCRRHFLCGHKIPRA